MIGETTRNIYARAGLNHRLGFGKRPAILVIDMQVGLTYPEKSPMAANLDSQIAAINKLIDAGRPHQVPLVFTAVAYEPNSRSLMAEKCPNVRMIEMGSDLAEVDPRLHRVAEDLVIIKQSASPFFGTYLASTLTARGVDTLITTGTATSGCVRAATIDGIAHGFRPIIPVEAVGDRAQEPHDYNLFDIDSKYGDVLPLSEVIAYLNNLRG